MADHKIPVGICLKRISDLLNLNWGIHKPGTVTSIILDFNSALNTICRMEGLQEYGLAKFLSEVTNMIRDFISGNLDKKIYVLYTRKENKTYLKEKLGAKYLDFFYDKRPDISDTIINMYIEKLEEMGKVSNIKVIDCGKFEPSIAAYLILSLNKHTIVYSRSKIMLGLIGSGGTFWDGTFLYREGIDPIDNASVKRTNAKYPFPTGLPYSLYPYYVCMYGIPDHGFKGKAGYGSVKSKTYLENHLQDIVAGTDEEFDYETFKYISPSEFLIKVSGKDEDIRMGLVELRAKLFT